MFQTRRRNEEIDGAGIDALRATSVAMLCGSDVGVTRQLEKWERLEQGEEALKIS